jgi:hypothetical protein
MRFRLRRAIAALSICRRYALLFAFAAFAFERRHIFRLRRDIATYFLIYFFSSFSLRHFRHLLIRHRISRFSLYYFASIGTDY